MFEEGGGFLFPFRGLKTEGVIDVICMGEYPLCFSCATLRLKQQNVIKEKVSASSLEFIL
jgi:hypothetical protein